MESEQNLSLRLAPDDLVMLRTTVNGDSHEVALDRHEFEFLYQHVLRIRAKLDLHAAREVISGPPLRR